MSFGVLFAQDGRWTGRLEFVSWPCSNVFVERSWSEPVPMKEVRWPGGSYDLKGGDAVASGGEDMYGECM